MKSITPDRCQQELQEQGGTDFGFAYGDAGRFRVAVFHQKGNVSLTLRLIPSRLLGFDDIGLPTIVKRGAAGLAACSWSPGRPVPARPPRSRR